MVSKNILASMTSTASLVSKNQKKHAVYILSDFPGIRSFSGLNDLSSLNSLTGLNDLYSLNSLSGINDLDSLISSKELPILMVRSSLAPK